MRVVNCSNAAQYFHVLRSQMRRPFRKPMIVISPKKLLKLRNANSDFEDFAEGLRFEKVLPDVGANMLPDSQIKKVLFCSG